MDAILGHAGGIDELAIILFPVFVGVGVWLLTRQKKDSPPQAAVTRSDPPENTGALRRAAAADSPRDRIVI